MKHYGRTRVYIVVKGEFGEGYSIERVFADQLKAIEFVWEIVKPDWKKPSIKEWVWEDPNGVDYISILEQDVV
jgi:hypothetical protein